MSVVTSVCCARMTSHPLPDGVAWHCVSFSCSCVAAVRNDVTSAAAFVRAVVLVTVGFGPTLAKPSVGLSCDDTTDRVSTSGMTDPIVIRLVRQYSRISGAVTTREYAMDTTWPALR